MEVYLTSLSHPLPSAWWPYDGVEDLAIGAVECEAHSCERLASGKGHRHSSRGQRHDEGSPFVRAVIGSDVSKSDYQRLPIAGCRSDLIAPKDFPLSTLSI